MNGASGTLTVAAAPGAFVLVPERCALLVIDMQHEFLSPGGWLDALGLDVTQLAEPARQVERVLAAVRTAGLPVFHTREGYEPDLASLAAWKRDRGPPAPGDVGPLGRHMVRGEPGHALAPRFAPMAGEPVFDKPGAGAFYATGLADALAERDVAQLVVCGVTLDCCVLASLFEANDRGFHCLLVGDATGTYDPATTEALLRMLRTGVIASVCTADDLVAALEQSFVIFAKAGTHLQTPGPDARLGDGFPPPRG